jgi:hypothetical protein
MAPHLPPSTDPAHLIALTLFLIIIYCEKLSCDSPGYVLCAHHEMERRGGKNYTLRCTQNTFDHLTAVQEKEIQA